MFHNLLFDIILVNVDLSIFEVNLLAYNIVICLRDIFSVYVIQKVFALYCHLHHDLYIIYCDLTYHLFIVK